MNKRLNPAGCIVLFFLASFSLFGCVNYYPHSVEFTPHYDRIGDPPTRVYEATGEACRHRLLGIFKWGNGSMSEAMSKLKSRGEIAMVTVDIRRGEFLGAFYIKTCTLAKATFVADATSGNNADAPCANARAPSGNDQSVMTFDDGEPDDFGPDELEQLNRWVGDCVEVTQRGGRFVRGALIKVDGERLIVRRRSREVEFTASTISKVVRLTTGRSR